MPGPMPSTPLPANVMARLKTFQTGCALARYLLNGYISRKSPPIWVEWAKRNLCWRHKVKR